MGTHLALLRSINVGPNQLPMPDLEAMFRAEGCTNVRTYIRSGNVVFSCDDDLAAALPERISAAISRSFGFSAPMVMRTAAEMATAAESNPFVASGADEKTLHVAFLAEAPAAAAIESRDPNRSVPDEIAVVGRDIYLRLPNGVARSKLTNAYFDSKLKTVSTLRNWRTVLALLEMASG